MSITGLTTTAGSDGVERVTSSQTVSGTSGVNGETITVGTGLYVGTSGTFTIESSHWRAHEPGTGNDTSAFLNFGTRTASNTMQVLDESMVLVERASGRSNAMLSNLKDSFVVVAGGSTEVFIYIQDGGEWERCTLEGINVIESIGTPGIFYQVKIIDAYQAFLNWEAGRIDRVGIDIPSTTSGYFTWLGDGGSNVNHVWDWNPVRTTIDDLASQTMPDSGEYCLAREPSSDEYHWGFTMAYQFKDLDSGNNQTDVLLIYSDDRDNLGGSLSEVGRWTSGSDGILEGTVDSRTRTTGSSQDRPIVFVEKQLADFGSSRSSGVTDPPSVNQYTMEDITFNLEVRSYGHLEEPIKTTLDNELGKMAGDYTVDEYREYLLKSDPGVTGTKAAADALTEIADLEDFYDRTKAEWRDNDNYPLPEKDGNYIDIGSTNLTIDLYAVGTAWAYSSGTSTITIYPGSDGIIDATTKYTGIKTTGTITLANGADTDAILIDSSGSRVFITLTNIVVGSRYQIYKTSDQSLIAQGEATSSTITEPYIWTTDTAVTIVIRQSSFSQRYIPYITSGTITQSGLAIVVSQVEDTLASELAAFTQFHFRWRNDNGDEGGATWKQNEDVNHTGQAKLSNIRLRISVDETYGVSGSITPTLQYRKVGDTTWDDV